MAWQALALPAAAAGLDFLGSVGSAKMSQDMAREQMDFQREMSNTAYQRAASDLSAAGLNRILALGSPASTPGGAMGATNMAGLGSNIIGGAKAVSDIKTQTSQQQLMKQQGAQAEATAKQAETQAGLNEANTKIRDEIANIVETPEGFRALLNSVKNAAVGGLGSAKQFDRMLQKQLGEIEDKLINHIDDFLDQFNTIRNIPRTEKKEGGGAW